jgi:O-antigen/teichoic acid export membrane protein
VLSVVGLVALAPVLLHAHPDDVRLFRVAALTVPFGLVMDVMGAIVLGRRRYGLTYLAAVTGAGVRAAALVVLALFGALTVTSAVWATLLPGLFVMVLYARVFRSGEESDPPPRVPVTRTLSSYGLRSWGIGIAGTANARLDQVLLLPVAGAAQLGYYAVAVSLAELTTPITGAISQVLFPEAAARRSWKSVSKAARCTMLVVVTIAVGGIATAPFLVPLLFGNEFSKAVPMAQILFVAGVPLALRLVMGSGLLAAGRPWASSTSQVLALCVTAPGLILLVPRFGGIGAACTSLAAYSTACTFSYRQARRASGLGLRELLVPGRDDVRWLLRQAEYCVPRKRRPVTGDA